jgi:virulence-associated protein VagC
VIPFGEPVIPEGSELIITVLKSATESRSERQRRAFETFMENTKDAPPLPPEFDEIIRQRVSINREIDL